MAAGWAVTFAFLLLPHWFKITAIVSLLRSSGLTWSWICIVRRHLNEVNQIAHRPKLQTIISIASAHPFAPRFYETVLPTEIRSNSISGYWNQKISFTRSICFSNKKKLVCNSDLIRILQKSMLEKTIAIYFKKKQFQSELQMALVDIRILWNLVLVANAS